jgi:murein DD-endopeptidase MepM/ murein hydrolase activator NlpD
MKRTFVEKNKFINSGNYPKYNSLYFSYLVLFLFFASCNKSTTESSEEMSRGCDGQIYPSPSTSPYVLPFDVGKTFSTGLTNCSASFHSPGQPDQYAFDFDMPSGTPFVAARSGRVIKVVENAISTGGDVGNYVLIDHGDETYAYYLHSPQNGIDVAVGNNVKQGDKLGVTGRSGQAGYPHLHFIVVQDPPEYPYKGKAISFRNASPSHTVLQSNTQYLALPY